MKKTNPLILFIILIGLLSACVPDAPVASSGECSCIVLTLEMSDTSYGPGDPIEATIRIRNTGNQAITINKRMAVNFFGAPEAYRDLEYVLVSPSGDFVPYGVRVEPGEVTDWDFIDLSPGDDLEIVYDLRSGYSIDEQGYYYVLVIYQNQSDPADGRVAWKGEVGSNVVRFEYRP